MKIVFGLGNVGKEYASSRHNLGEANLRAWEAQATTDELEGVKLVYPLGLMNNSGLDFKREIKIEPAQVTDLLVIHDDLELAVGECKLTTGGSAKGHNGVRSGQEVLDGLQVTRLRLGIGRPPLGITARDFVLAKFSPEEKVQLLEMTKRAIGLIDQFLFGVEAQDN